MERDRDTVLMESIGHNHQRPGDRRLVLRDQTHSKMVVEQMANDDGGWRDVSRILRIKGEAEVVE